MQIQEQKMRVREIPIGTLGMDDVIELMELYEKKGYQTNIKSKSGTVVMQVVFAA